MQILQNDPNGQKYLNNNFSSAGGVGNPTGTSTNPNQQGIVATLPVQLSGRAIVACRAPSILSSDSSASSSAFDPGGAHSLDLNR